VHGVIDFLGCGLMRRLCGDLLHFLFCLQIDGAIFAMVVCFSAVIHAVRRFECVRPSATASAVIRLPCADLW
jgi:hypothetical protein